MYCEGRIGLPVPPRSAQSLDITESPYEPMYDTPNEVPSWKRPGEFTTCTCRNCMNKLQNFSRPV